MDLFRRNAGRKLQVVISEDWAQTKADLATFTTPTLTRTPFVAGHGGMPVNYQPNSLRGFIDAYEAGADALENDLHMTKDGVVVLMHGTGVYGQEANGDFIDDGYGENSRIDVGAASAI